MTSIPVTRYVRTTVSAQGNDETNTCGSSPIPFLRRRRIVAQTPQWSPKAATDWYAKQPWLVGANYIPAYAANQLEMWQPETFDIDRIDMEMGWAEALGMNTMRVYLHNLLWQEDPGGSTASTAASTSFSRSAKGTKSAPSSCFWIPAETPSPRPAGSSRRARASTIPDTVQSPGPAALTDPAQEAHLLEYIEDLILAFNTDERILAWDLWNEPDNTNKNNSYAPTEPANKVALVGALLPKIFRYARAGLPSTR